MEKIIIRQGISLKDRFQAGKLFMDAFYQKFRHTVKNESTFLNLISTGLNLDYCISAYENSKLLGICGFQYGKYRFVNFYFRDFIKRYGIFAGTAKCVACRFYYRKHKDGELLMDGITVEKTARGLGIGSRMIKTLFSYATATGFKSIRLDVIDTNANARRLYEKLGFKAIKTEKSLFYKDIGFNSITTMIKDIS
jgi:ribosomal protein S18 acetylase RimI-like enzyme